MRFDVWQNGEGGARIARVDLPDGVGELELLELLCRAGHPKDFGPVQAQLGMDPSAYEAEKDTGTCAAPPGTYEFWMVRPRKGELAPNGKVVPVLVLMPTEGDAPLFSELPNRRTFRVKYESELDKLGRRTYFLDWEEEGGRKRGQIFRGVPAEQFKRLRSDGHIVIEPKE